MSINRHDKSQRMSQAVTYNGVIHLAGQVAGGETVADQTAGILAKVDALLAANGSDKQSLLSATIWLTNMDTFAEMNAVWDAWVDVDNPPARACVESPKLATPEFLVEIMVVAAQSGN